MSEKALLRKVLQIGLVVRDARGTAKRCWDDFGMGPWTFYTFDPARVTDMTVHGKRLDHAMLTAHARVGDIEWELVEPLDERSIYAEHLRTHGEGLHHILFDVESYADAKAHMERKGYEELAHGKWVGNAFSYFNAQGSLHCIAEIFSPPDDWSTLPAPETTYP